MYTCEHFVIQELVHPTIYADRGYSSWKILDERILISIDQIRKKFGRMICNTWHSKKLQALFGEDAPDHLKIRTLSGLRPTDTGFGADYSDHKFGRAIDLLCWDTPVEEVRAYILSHPDEFPYITCVEANTGWLHISCRNTTRIELVYP